MKSTRISLLRQALFSLLKTSPTSLLIGFLGLGFTPTAKAQISLEFVEQAGSTTVTWSGAWSVWGSISGTFPASTLNMSPKSFNMLGASGELFEMRTASNSGSATIPWIDAAADPTSFSGDSWGFEISGNNLNTFAYAPSGYIQNDALNGSATFLNRSLSQLGFDASEIANGGTITIQGTVITWSATSAVPEPGAFAFIAGIVILGSAAFRRRPRVLSS